MKKLSLIAALTLSTMLSACGGGGGGHGYVPTTTLPTIPDRPSVSEDPNVDSVETKELTTAASSASTGDDIVAYFDNMENPSQRSFFKARMFSLFSETEENAEPAVNSCSKGDASCIRGALQFIKTKLIKSNKITEITDELQQALVLAGYYGNYEDIDNINEWVKDSDNQIKMEKLCERFSDKKQTIEDVKFKVMDNDVNEGDAAQFFVDENGQIIDMAFDVATYNPQTKFHWNSDEKSFIGSEDRIVYEIFVKNPGDPEKPIHYSVDVDKSIQDKEKIKNAFLTEYQEDKKIIEDIFNQISSLDDFKHVSSLQDFKNGKKLNDDVTLSSCNQLENMKIDFVSYGLGKGEENPVKLEYSDFGVIKLTGEYYINDKYQSGDDTDRAMVFAGGYDIKRIDRDLIKDKNLEFEGSAVAGVNYSINDNDGQGEVFHGSAKLNFDNGEETLTTDFTKDGWYKVVVTSNANQDNYNINFSGDVKDEKYRFTQASAQDFVKDDDQNSPRGKVDIGYYGNGQPTEATGSLLYREDYGNVAKDEIDSRWANIAFGAVKK